MDLKAIIGEQRRLALKVTKQDRLRDIRLVGGCDQAFFENKMVSGIVVMGLQSLKIIEKTCAIIEEPFPYIPGLLAYREVPAILEASRKLKYKPDVLLCDFNGILHPRFFGAACDLGLKLDICTVGVAKSLLCGRVKQGFVYIGEKKVGFELRNRNFRPLYISPGHKISLESSVEIVKKLIKNDKLPEPIRLAHLYANEVKNAEIQGYY